MRRRSFRVSIATLLIVGGCAAALAFVTASNAGSTGADLQLFPQPSVVTVNGTGFIKASFKAASGAQTGSATHVMITVSLASGLVFDQADSSANCAIADPLGHPNDVVCSINSVSPGETVNRYVVFTAPSATGNYVTNGSVIWDNGSGGAGGGGAVNTPQPADGPATTIVSGTADPNAGGGCFFKGGGNTHSGPANKNDNQSTSADVGTVDPTLGIPCAYADVGEDGQGAPVGHGFVTAISHDNIAKLTGPATITITLYSLPVPFPRIVWHYIADYTSVSALNDISTYPTIAPCQSGKLPANAPVCLLSKSNQGQGATWTFLQIATGSDPGFGS